MASWVSKVVGGIVLICGCATSYGPAFTNTGSVKADVYLYGAHAAAPADPPELVSEQRGDEPSASGTEREGRVATKPSRAKPASTKTVVEQDGGLPEPGALALEPGTYEGTDWVTIDLPGLPGNEQVDEKARVLLAIAPGESRLSFTVLDTNSGSELCKVEGAVVNDLVAFEAGQACFEGILGVPMQTALYEGEGRIGDGRLVVTLGIELTITSPDGDEVAGDLSYRFEGKLADSAGK